MFYAFNRKIVNPTRWLLAITFAPVSLFLYSPKRSSSVAYPLFSHIPGKAPASTGMSQVHDAPLRSRRLLRGEVTYSVAKEQDHNILHELGYRDQKIQYFTHLYRNRKLIETTIARHLGLTSADTCHLVDVEDWIDGSFNVCIRVDIDVDDRTRLSGKQLMIRFPLPYRIGENTCPGNADEKVRCEAGTYAWLQENCPDVPIPKLYGFGLSTGETVRMYLTSAITMLLLTILVHSSRPPAFGNPWRSISTPSTAKMVTLSDSISLCSASNRCSSRLRDRVYSD